MTLRRKLRKAGVTRFDVGSHAIAIWTFPGELTQEEAELARDVLKRKAPEIEHLILTLGATLTGVLNFVPAPAPDQHQEPTT